MYIHIYIYVYILLMYTCKYIYIYIHICLLPLGLYWALPLEALVELFPTERSEVFSERSDDARNDKLHITHTKDFT